MATKLMPGNITIWAVYPEGIADPKAPAASELNDADFAFNISCAIEDDYTLGMTASDTSDARTICDVGEVSTPTFKNAEASLDGFRDEDMDANGVFNLFFDLFKSDGCPFYLVKRVGYSNTTPAAAGQDVTIVEVTTDNPEDIVGDQEWLMLGARFKVAGVVEENVELV